jgi:hypothetical protein
MNEATTTLTRADCKQYLSENGRNGCARSRKDQAHDLSTGANCRSHTSTKLCKDTHSVQSTARDGGRSKALPRIPLLCGLTFDMRGRNRLGTRSGKWTASVAGQAGGGPLDGRVRPHPVGTATSSRESHLCERNTPCHLSELLEDRRLDSSPRLLAFYHQFQGTARLLRSHFGGCGRSPFRL